MRCLARLGSIGSAAGASFIQVLLVACIVSPAASPASTGTDPTVLTSVAAVRGLTTDEARRRHPVRLTGVITYRAPDYGVTFLQDRTGGIFVFVPDAGLAVKEGAVVEVLGQTTAGDFAPSIERAQVRVLGRAPLPAPSPATLDNLFTGLFDSQWVSVRGIVQSVEVEDRLPPDMRSGSPQLVLGLATGQLKFKARIRTFSKDLDYQSLIDSVVSVQGACGTVFNQKRQLVGIQLFVPSLDQVVIEKAAPLDAFAGPVSAIRSLMQFTPGRETGRRIRVRGVVTLRAESWVVVQDASGGVVVEDKHPAVNPGDVVNVIGFPTAGQYVPGLRSGERERGPAVPRPARCGLGADGCSDARTRRLCYHEGHPSEGGRPQRPPPHRRNDCSRHEGRS
jgi:hypothetical protein